jgi:hypothetical protein
MHKHNSFITLTFNPEELEKRDSPWSLDVRDYQLFMKRLRKKHKKTIRFFHCGEYGDKNKRPHYHALLFGHDFPDRRLFRERDGIKLYTSTELEELWPYGFSTVGELTFQSAAYTARYIMKKHKGEGKDEHYTTTDPRTGEIHKIQPEYCTMSRRSGLGYDWFQKYKDDVYPNDYVICNGHEIKPPRYYDSLLPEHELLAIKKKRQEAADDPITDYDDRMDRLFVEEEVKIRKLETLVRNL